MPARTLKAGSIALQGSLSVQVPKIFEQAQISTANHQKNLVALYKLQIEAAKYREEVKKGRGSFKLVGEKLFEEEVIRLLQRVLPVKKGVSQADRVAKFIGQYVEFVNQKHADERNAEEGAEGEDEDDDDDDSMASRFTVRLLKFFLKGFQAKDKTIRFRVLQAVAEMVSHLGELDEDTYSELRTSLLDRLNDREAPVRLQASIALSKLSIAEDPSEVAEGEQSMVEVLQDTLQYDSSADVRRAVLLNIPITTSTLPAILDRMRDSDTTIRKLVYSVKLQDSVTIKESNEMGLTHPRAFTIAQREHIIRTGLGDREPTVRAAAASLLLTWVDSVTARAKKEEEEEVKQETQQEETVESGLVELLKMLDLSQEEYPVEAVLSIFASRPAIYDTMKFGAAYWDNLSPETAFLARVFVDHGRATNDNTRLEAVLPEVTHMAFCVQDAFNTLSTEMDNEEDAQLFQALSEEDKARFEDARLEKEAILGELLQLVVKLDYSDEIGRRKMFQLVRDMLSKEILPSSLLNKCLDVLRVLSTNERDLIRLVVELVQDLRDKARIEEDDPIKDEGSPDETPATVRVPRPPRERTAEEQERADAIDLKCLSLCIGMLERTLEENTVLDGILRELVIPSVKRKDFKFREKGLLSLGMCCLIAKRLALDSVAFFINQLSSSPPSLQLTLLKIVFDVIMAHEREFRREEHTMIFDQVIEHLLGILGSETSDEVLALLCLGFAKLVLAGMAKDSDQLVLHLIQAYVSPATVDNQELRQCLTHFFKVFSYSSPANQEAMSRIFLRTYRILNNDRATLDDHDDMISPLQIGNLFIDWTDPAMLRVVVDAQGRTDPKHQANMSIQLNMASDILRALLKEDWNKEDKKVLCQVLTKLHIPDTVEDDKVRELKVLMHALRSRRPLRDTTTNTAFSKFETAITKKFEKQLEDFSEEEYRKLEQLENIFEFVDSIIPDDDDEEVLEPKRKGKKRRSESVMTATTEGEDPSSVGSSRRGGSRPRSKRPRFSKSDEDSDDSIIPRTAPPPPARTLPKRAAATKKPIVIEPSFVSSGSDEERTPIPRSKPTREKSWARLKEEEELDAELDALPDTTFDSIIDGTREDDEEEEEELEVNDSLLIED